MGAIPHAVGACSCDGARMRGALWLQAAIMFLVVPGRAQAVANWLEVRGTCDADVELLARRIEEEVAGARPPELSLTLEFEASAVVRGQLSLMDGLQRVGEKHVQADSCEAALELMTAIAALALSSFALPAEAEPEEAALDQSDAAPGSRCRSDESACGLASASVHAQASLVQTHAVARAADDTALVRSSRKRHWHLLASAGVSLGAGTPTTLLVAGGGAALLGPGEVRLLGRYGAPSTEERVDAAARRVRRDFGAAALDYCYGLDRERWISMCAGGEVMTRRSEVVSTTAQGERSVHTQRHSTVGPSAAVILALREVVMQPQLELSTVAAVWGASPSFGFRAAVGGSLPF